MFRKIDLIVERLPEGSKRIKKKIESLKHGLIFVDRDLKMADGLVDNTYYKGTKDALISIVDVTQSLMQNDTSPKLLKEYLKGLIDGYESFINDGLNIIEEDQNSAREFNLAGNFDVFSDLIGLRGSLNSVNRTAKTILRNLIPDFDEETFNLQDATDKEENFPAGFVIDRQLVSDITLKNDEDFNAYLDVFYLLDRSNNIYVTEVSLSYE